MTKEGKVGLRVFGAFAPAISRSKDEREPSKHSSLLFSRRGHFPELGGQRRKIETKGVSAALDRLLVLLSQNNLLWRNAECREVCSL